MREESPYFFRTCLCIIRHGAGRTIRYLCAAQTGSLQKLRTPDPSPAAGQASTCPQLSPSGLAHAPEAAHSPWGHKGDSFVLRPTYSCRPKAWRCRMQKYLCLFNAAWGGERKRMSSGKRRTVPHLRGGKLERKGHGQESVSLAQKCQISAGTETKP